MVKLLVKKINDNARLPTLGSKEAACFDLYISEDTVLPYSTGVLVPTGLAFQIPPGYCLKVYGRSSMCRQGILVSTGIIDSDFTGEVKVQCFNVGSIKPIMASRGDRVGQAMLVKLTETELEETTGDLRETERGTKGWGSTGL